ncbi:preprotein translocase subunit SecE [Flexivirga caeni]|uniref:preprotein translocase subunit SecE n=1 Tax=Flexivirga caeni TaxID=2294115 RepID=UPI001FE6C8B3|nr:preprotein translocase subunit SecE [Flexivirga caeni]
MSTSTASPRGSTEEKSPRGLGKIWLFIRQVIDELRKVVRPTRDELVSYTIALIVFLALIMAYVLGLDQLMERFVSWIFG